MAETRYRDRYAQIRQIHVHNRSVCYWRNNLSSGDFRRERGWYVFEDEGSYNGLSVKMKISVKTEDFKKIFRRKMKGLVVLQGSPNHLGIRIRIKKDLFPRKCSGTTGAVKYEFEMSGTIRGLSFVNNELGKRERRAG